MIKIQTSIIDPEKFFNVNDLDYPKGQYIYKYRNEVTDSGEVNEDIIEVAIVDKYTGELLVSYNKFKNYINAANEPYSSLTNLLTDLPLLLGFNSGQSVPQNYIPLTGTVANKPVTGDIQIGGQVTIGASANGGLIAFTVNESDLTFFLYRIDPLSQEMVTLSMSDTESIQVSGDNPDFKGISGADDYSTKVTDLCYVQKTYVDSVSSQTTTQRSTATGGDETMRSGEKDLVFIHEAGLTTSLGLILPSFPANNQKVTIMSVGGINSLSLITSGGSIVGGVTTLVALGVIKLIWLSSQNKWYKIS